jgi:hypothetical protein
MHVTSLKQINIGCRHASQSQACGDLVARVSTHMFVRGEHLLLAFDSIHDPGKYIRLDKGTEVAVH